MITLKTFDNSIDAHLLKTKLESEGISCVLFDENIVSLDPLYNMAVGGIKLRIAENDQEKAILEAVFDDEEETPQKIKESKKMGCCLLPILIFVIVLVIPMVIKNS